jgi:predicted PurR-regulated permease PerM
MNPFTSRILVAVCIVAGLYFGREVLEPLALAAILGLVLSPLVRRLRRLGLGPTSATLSCVVLVGTALVWAGIVLATQLASVAAELPSYGAGMRAKVEQARQVLVKPFERLDTELDRVVPGIEPGPTAGPANDGARARPGPELRGRDGEPVLVQIRPPRPTPEEALSRFFGALWGPLGEAGIVLVLLVFILLEHEALRDRLVRLTGSTDIARTLRALADAGQGVSRFFLSQCVVNLAFALAMGLVLWLTGVPHPMLWAALAGLLRLVPYVGTLAAGAVVTAFAAAVDPGWSLALTTAAAFVGLEVFVSQVIEPQAYGHSAGLSPLAVIVAALCWGALWGPVGLILSTPLTLCLVVAGRHVAALEAVTILLGDTPGISLGQRLYQRALAGDSHAILQDARAFLRRASFARFCDHILLPAVALAGEDVRNGHIEPAQQERLRQAIVALVETLGDELSPAAAPRRRRRQASPSLAQANVGAHLRRIREERLGHWQGPLDVRPGSVVLCGGFSTERDQLVTELLVVALRSAGVDARSVLIDQPREAPPEPGAERLLAACFMVYPAEANLALWRDACRDLRESVPHLLLGTVRLAGESDRLAEALVQPAVDLIVHSFEEAVAAAQQAGTS